MGLMMLVLQRCLWPGAGTGWHLKSLASLRWGSGERSPANIVTCQIQRCFCWAVEGTECQGLYNCVSQGNQAITIINWLSETLCKYPGFLQALYFSKQNLPNAAFVPVFLSLLPCLAFQFPVFGHTIFLCSSRFCSCTPTKRSKDYSGFCSTAWCSHFINDVCSAQQSKENQSLLSWRIRSPPVLHEEQLSPPAAAPKVS